MSEDDLGTPISGGITSKRAGLSRPVLGSVGVKIGVKGHPPLRFRVLLGDGTHELEVLY